MYIWKTFIEGDVNAFVLALQQCQGIEPDVSLLELCERYALGKKLKKKDPKILAKELGLPEKEFHDKYKKKLKKKYKKDLEDHEMGNNPDILTDKDGNLYFRDVKTGKTIPLEDRD